MQCETTPDIPAVLYINIPTVHNGDEIAWTLEQKSIHVPAEREYSMYRSSGYGYTTPAYTKKVLTLTATWGTENITEEVIEIEDILDKDILDAAKKILNTKERRFRNLLLENGPVQICQPPKKPST